MVMEKIFRIQKNSPTTHNTQANKKLKKKKLRRRELKWGA